MDKETALHRYQPRSAPTQQALSGGYQPILAQDGNQPVTAQKGPPGPPPNKGSILKRGG